MNDRAKPKVLLLASVPDDLQEEISKVCDVLDGPGGPIADAGQLKAALANADGVLSTIRTRFTEDVLDASAHLRVVSNFAVGYDNIDVAAATRRGIAVCNTPGVLDRAVADLTMIFIFCLSRNVMAAERHLRSGGWKRGEKFPLSSDVAGKTVGILGLGRIGREVARLAQALGMRTLYNSRTRDPDIEAELRLTYCERDELFRQADFVSIHLPTNAETRRSVGAREFALMKASAYLINTSRGAVVDEPALIEALESGRIRGAGLDVMESEPLDPGHPLCTLPNVMMQPHVASATVETRRAMMELAVRNLVRTVTGQRPQAVVNAEVLNQKPASLQAG